MRAKFASTSRGKRCGGQENVFSPAHLNKRPKKKEKKKLDLFKQKRVRHGLHRQAGETVM